jgi:hypothetical protein
VARRTRRPAVRPAPWKGGGWKDAPGALPVQVVDPARLAEALAASGYRAFRVGVYAFPGPRSTAYVCYTGRTLDILGGACEHDVTAKTRDAAKRLAVQEHKEKCAR